MDRWLVALRKESVDRNLLSWSLSRLRTRSLSARRAWIEMHVVLLNYKEVLSLSARRAWIEILLCGQRRRLGAVALRKESVDRNVFGFGAKLVHSVALRKESVDRNYYFTLPVSRCLVALRKESVDRNIPSIGTLRNTHVALRKESVDRNLMSCSVILSLMGSLSARRAWIEIGCLGVLGCWAVGRSPQGERG